MVHSTETLRRGKGAWEQHCVEPKEGCHWATAAHGLDFPLVPDSQGGEDGAPANLARATGGLVRIEIS